MDVLPSPQPCAVVEVDKKQDENQNDLSYAAAVKSRNQSAEEVSKLDLCPVSIENGIPTVEFTVEDVNLFTREEGLHQAVVIKFSYGKPVIQDLRSILPKHFEVKGNYSIGQLEFCHILVRFDLFEDFAKVVSRSSGYVQSKGDVFFYRTFPWTMDFNPREETSKAVVWISFPHLPANLFARKSLMSIASVVGKPISVDKATKDRTRPSMARVKVLINILDKHPNKIKIKILDTNSGKMIENEQQIVMDNLPKYCTLCNHRDHDIKSCRWNTEDFIGKVPLSNETEGNLTDLGHDAREILNEIKAGSRSVLKSNPVNDAAQQGIAKIPKEMINVAADKSKETESIKTTSLAVFNNVIANSNYERGSISGIKGLNARHKSYAKQWRAVQPVGTIANVEASKSLLGDQQLSTDNGTVIEANDSIVKQHSTIESTKQAETVTTATGHGMQESKKSACEISNVSGLPEGQSARHFEDNGTAFVQDTSQQKSALDTIAVTVDCDLTETRADQQLSTLESDNQADTVKIISGLEMHDKQKSLSPKLYARGEIEGQPERQLSANDDSQKILKDQGMLMNAEVYNPFFKQSAQGEQQNEAKGKLQNSQRTELSSDPQTAQDGQGILVTAEPNDSCINATVEPNAIQLREMDNQPVQVYERDDANLKAVTEAEAEFQDTAEQKDLSNIDMEEESTDQNFLNVAKIGDISPRHIDPIKCPAKGKNKQTKQDSNAKVPGVQTRSTLSKHKNN